MSNEVKSTDRKTVADIIKAAGGRDNIAQICNVTVHAVDRWHTTGIPRKYWDFVLNNTPVKITLQTVYHADRAARSRKDLPFETK